MASEFELNLERFWFPGALADNRANFRFVVDIRLVRGRQVRDRHRGPARIRHLVGVRPEEGAASELRARRRQHLRHGEDRRLAAARPPHPRRLAALGAGEGVRRRSTRCLGRAARRVRSDRADRDRPSAAPARSARPRGRRLRRGRGGPALDHRQAARRRRPAALSRLGAAAGAGDREDHRARDFRRLHRAPASGAARSETMDPIAHTLLGAALARTKLGRDRPLAMPVLVLASNAPDIDVVAYFWSSDVALAFAAA